VGGQGAGPGEFQGLRWIGQHNPDSLYTFDARQRRISVFGRSGQFVRSINLRPTETIAFPGFVDLFQNGDILATGSPPGPPLTNVRSGIVAPDHYLVRYEPDGATARILTSVPSDQMFHLVEENGRIIAAPLLFGRSTQIFPWIDRILVATNDQYEIKVYDADGGLVLVIRRTVDDVAVSDADIEASIQGNLNSEETDFGRRLLNRLFGAMPIPDTFPAFSSVHLDELGQLWVQDYNRPGDDRNRWAVLDAEGQWLGMVDLPGSFSPLDIGADYVLGLWRDEDDVEHVRMYELVKPK
jgi:hypothetical protein